MHVSYDQWMKGTYSLTKRRSAQLKAVDQTLKQYDQLKTRKQLGYLEYAFSIWKGIKGSKWEESSRNEKGMVTALDKMLKLPKSQLTPMEVQIQQQHERINSLFRQRTLKPKHSTARSKAKHTLTALKVKKVHTLTKEVVGVNVKSEFEKLLNQLISNFFNTDSVGSTLNPLIKQEIVATLGAQFLPEFIKSMTPYMGLITSGSNAVKEWGHTALAYYRKSEVISKREVTRAGSPREAVRAMQKIMQRETNSHASKAKISTVEFSAKGIVHLSGAGAMGDTVIGGLSAFAKLSHALFLVGRDYVEKRDANDKMQSAKNIDHTIFDGCPIIGCYYIVCSDTSDIINFMIEDMGNDGWMDEIETLKKDLSSIESQARRLIDNHTYMIPNMPKLKMSDKIQKELGVNSNLTSRAKFAAKRVRGAIPIG